MKKVSSIILGFLFVFILKTISYGQTEQGKIFLAGASRLDMTSTKSLWKTDDDEKKTGKNFSMDFSPMVGYFVAKNLVVGLEIPISYRSEDDEDNSKASTLTFAGAPFCRYYFGNEKIKPFLQGSAGAGLARVKYEYGDTDYDEKSTLFTCNLGGGVAFFVNEKIAIDFQLSYIYLSLKPNEDNDNNYRDINKGITGGVGISISL